MPLFTCQFRDPAGVMRETTVDAVDDLDAAQKLAALGIRGARVWRTDPVIAQAAPPPVSPFAPPPVVSPASHAVAAYAGRRHRTKRGTDRERFVLFSQISKQLNAGINPAQVLANVGRVSSFKHFVPSFREMSVAAEQGHPLSDVMESYPDLYPESVVGTARAGEAGGFMPEAFETIANQAQEAHKFKRYHWFIWYLVPRAVVALPIVFLIRYALLEGWKQATPGGDGMALFTGLLWKGFLWPFGPLTVAVAGALLLLRWWLGSAPMTRLRHTIGLHFPIYGARARNESIAVFTWALSKLSRSGVPPHRAWQIAMDCVPNLEMRDRLAKAGAMMSDGSRLSDAIFGSRLFPEEYAPIVSTGEIAGDMEGALNQLAAASRDEFSQSTNKAKFASARFGCVFALITSGAILIILCYAWYREFLPTVLNDFQVD